MASTYDVAVIGLGAMGSAALDSLARRHKKVIGFDRWSPGHPLASSTGESRIFRTAYFEDPSYVPLLKLAYQHWRQLEADTGTRVLIQTGILEAGHPGATIVEGSLESAIQHGLPHEVLSASKANERFPALRLPAEWQAVFQPDAGILLADKIIELFVSRAQALGATVQGNTQVRTLRPKGDHVELVLDTGTVIEAASAIVSPGPWMADLVAGLGLSLKVTRQPVVWVNPKNPSLVTPERLPVFLLQSQSDVIYGFPDFCGTGVKAASHLAQGDVTSADDPRSQVCADEERRVTSALEHYIPAAAGKVRRSNICVYTRTPDEHFILGLHPEAPQIVLASPCSGHGFKFSSVFGEILADLAISRATDKPICLFRPDRFGLPAN